MNKVQNQKILIAVAWPYVNGNLHVGHLAGYLLPADIFARFQRLLGNDVLMVSGSDCHGTPITVQADKEGISPEEVVKKYHIRDVELFNKYKLSYNLYTTTVTKNHKEVVQQLFLDLLKNDCIVKGTMKQYYSPEDDEFLPDRYVEGICPHCKAGEQRSDQCENCGRWLSDGELIDPVSKKTGKSVELKDTEHYFLDFESLSNDLEDYLQGKIDGVKKQEIWRSWVFKEASGWLKEGMKKRAITRDIDWGIDLPKAKIPKDKLIENIDKKKIYVWFEAVTGYLSAPQEWSLINSKFEIPALPAGRRNSKEVIFNRQKGQSTDWQDWWLNKDSKHYYFMGQDNLVFHTLMWPAELMGAKKGYTLPYNIVVNKFMNFNNAKFSKSRGNIIDSEELADEFGVDAVRYFVLSNLPENKETNFTWERFIDAVNNELVGNLGNFINRTLVFYTKNNKLQITNNKLSKEIVDHINEAIANFESRISNCEFVEALNEVMELSRHGNKYFNDSEIWKVIKEDEKKAEQIMFDLLNIVEALRILIRPFFPDAFEKLSNMLGVDIEEEEVGKNLWEFKPISGYPDLKEVKTLFQKIDKEKVLKEKVSD